MLSSAVAACAPDVGECDPDLAKALYYTAEDAAQPAYAGQALVISSCGSGSFCHAPAAVGEDRYGVPAELDFDLTLAETLEQTQRLRRDIARVRDLRGSIWQQVHEEWMPPGQAGDDVLALGVRFSGLPSIDSAEGKDALRNWLACGAPIVERTTPRPDGFVAVGDVVPALACEGAACGGECVSLSSNAQHCGACDSACGPETVCAAGSCIEGGCPVETTECAGGCVDTATSFHHCGGCGASCTAGMECSSGACVTSLCPVGRRSCDGVCVNTSTSAAHCGGCNMACTGTEVCVAGTCTACDPSVTLSGHVQPIFTASCTGSTCHSGTRPQADLSLDAGRAHAELVGVGSRCSDGKLLVAPGDVDGSYLINKLTGEGICTGMRMPVRAEPLSPAQMGLIRNWICSGARND